MEDALLPMPKVSDFHDKRMLEKALNNDLDEVMVDLIDGRSQPELVENKGNCRNIMRMLLSTLVMSFQVCVDHCND